MKTLLIAILVASLAYLAGCRKSAAPAVQTNPPAVASPTEQPPNPAGGTTTSDVKYFRGSIGSALGLQMKLISDGEKLSGQYYYQKIGTKIDLKGTVDKDNNLTLEEFDPAGKQTGIFKGLWRIDEEDSLITIAGNWTTPTGDKKTAFSLHQEPIQLTGNAEIGAKSIKESNKKLNYEISADYPQVTGAMDGRFDRYNQEARNLVTRKVAEFRKDMVERAKEQADSEPSTTGSDLGIGYTIGVATDDVISTQFDIGGYYQGAAHPNSYTQVLNYDVKAARVLKLADLFKPGAKYLPVISSYCIKDLQQQSKSKGAMLDREEIERGAGPEAKNFQSWTITRKGLGINFDAYQVGPYAAGPQYVLIPYSAIRDFVKPDGPLGPIIK